MKDMLSTNALHYPFGYLLNPNGNEMDQIIGSWIKNEYSFLPDRFKKKYSHTGMGHCAGCAYPLATLDQLKAVCSFFIWAFSVDDLYEKSSVQKIQEVEDISILALKEGILTSNDPLYAQLPVMRKRLIEIGSEQWLTGRFCDSLRLYFKGLKEALPYRVTHIFPTIEEYVRIRIMDVNVFPMVNLAEAVTGKILPDYVIKHPALDRLSALTAKILYLANDYFSAFQEDGNNVMNLVLLIKDRTGCTWEDAYEEMIGIHDRDVEEFKHLAVNLPDFGDDMEAVYAFVANLKYMIAGYLHWTLKLTERYKLGGHPTDYDVNEKMASL